MESTIFRFRHLASFLVIALWLAGCQSGCISERGRTLFSQTDPAQERFELISLFESGAFDACAPLAGPPPLSASIDEPSSGSGGISLNNQTARSDAADFQSAIESQLYGENGGGPAESQPANSGALNSSPPPNNGIRSISRIGRDRTAFPRVQMGRTSRDATIDVEGTASVTRDVQVRRRTETQVSDNAPVRLTYMLSKVAGTWRCTAVYADPIGPPTGGDQRRGGGGDFSNRIGW